MDEPFASGLAALAAALCEAEFSDGVGPVLDGVHHRLVDTIGVGSCGGATFTPVLVGGREAPDRGADLGAGGFGVPGGTPL